MSNANLVSSHGRLVLSKESIGKIKILSSVLVKGVKILVTFVNKEENINANIFIDSVRTFSEKTEESDDIEDIFLIYLLSEYGGTNISGYIVGQEGKKFSIDILCLSGGDFGVYKIDLGSEYESPQDFDLDPSFN